MPALSVRITRVALLLLAAACRYQPSPVPVRGAPGDLAGLAGNWTGEYSSGQSHRSGILSFTLAVGSDTAYGDVVMTPTAGQPIIAADAHDPSHAQHATSPTVLAIRFVAVAGGVVQGTLEPYVAPDCSCTVRTVFRGVLNGDGIDGHYLTTGAYGLRQEGRWSAWRRAVAAQ